jgi:prepilin-type N-terminal cleavage/methylation domain-containing protein
MIKSKRGKGFTLVELIVVVAVLLILSVLAVVAYSNITASARQAALRADGSRLAGALNNYNSMCPGENVIVGIDPNNPNNVTVVAPNNTPVTGSSHRYADGTLSLTIAAASLGLSNDVGFDVTMPEDRWVDVIQALDPPGANGVGMWTIE